jgi:Flp pilus assembly protein TadG
VIKKLDERGVAALEFCLVAVPFFTLMFAIFDLGRYAITMHSLRMLADAGARAMMINCYTDDVIKNQPFTNCLVDPLPSDAAKQAVAPMLYAGGLTPVLTVAFASTNPSPPANGALTVTASFKNPPGFTMLMPIWGGALDQPSASTSIAF